MIFKKNTLKYAAAASLLFLGGCPSMSHTSMQNKFSGRIVEEQKLANGKILMTAMKAPDASAGCNVVYEDVRSSFKDSMSLKGMLGNEQWVLKDAAIEYVNAHPNDNINYAYLDVPNQMGIGNVQFDLRKAQVHYYKCSNPPAANWNPFKG
jgi:hypothetical protein